MTMLRTMATELGIPLLPTPQVSDTRVYRFVPDAKERLAAVLSAKGYKVRTFGTDRADILKPDFAKEGYYTGTLWIYDPSTGNGALTWQTDYTWIWRASHEYGHAATLAQLDWQWGPGRRSGKLGAPLTVRECLRAIDWECETFDEQWTILRKHGLLDRPDMLDYWRENAVNTLDAVARCLTGAFTDPATEGIDIRAWQEPKSPSHMRRWALEALERYAGTCIRQTL